MFPLLWVAVCETSTRRGILSSLPPCTTRSGRGLGPDNADDGVTPDVSPRNVSVLRDRRVFYRHYLAGHYSLLSSFSSFFPSSLVSP